MSIYIYIYKYDKLSQNKYNFKNVNCKNCKKLIFIYSNFVCYTIYISYIVLLYNILL